MKHQATQIQIKILILYISWRVLATSVAPVNNIADKLFSVNLNLIDLIIRASTTQRSSAVSSEWFSVDGMRLYGALWCKAPPNRAGFCFRPSNGNH